jgi:hypothetical protein
MKGTMIARTLLGLGALTLIAATAMAADNAKSNITINGGRNTVFMGAPSHVAESKPCTKGKFYDNICNGSINIDEGWTVSDGSPINTEYTPANQIIALKSGTTKKLGVTVAFVTGTNGAIVTLDKDCKNLPCGTIDKTHLCVGKIKNLYNAGNPYTVENMKCVAKLTKGKAYWVYVQSDANSWLAWDLSAATGGLIEGTNDVWGTYASGQSVGGVAIY